MPGHAEQGVELPRQGLRCVLVVSMLRSASCAAALAMDKGHVRLLKTHCKHCLLMNLVA